MLRATNAASGVSGDAAATASTKTALWKRPESVAPPDEPRTSRCSEETRDVPPLPRRRDHASDRGRAGKTQTAPMTCRSRKRVWGVFAAFYEQPVYFYLWYQGRVVA